MHFYLHSHLCNVLQFSKYFYVYTISYVLQVHDRQRGWSDQGYTSIGSARTLINCSHFITDVYTDILIIQGVLVHLNGSMLPPILKKPSIFWVITLVFCTGRGICCSQYHSFSTTTPVSIVYNLFPFFLSYFYF